MRRNSGMTTPPSGMASRMPPQDIHQVFFGMAIGREVQPVAAAALPAIVSERVLEAGAPRVDGQVAVVQQHLNGIEPVQDLVVRPPSEGSLAEDEFVLGVGGRTNRRSSGRSRVDADQVDAAIDRGVHRPGP